MLIGGAPFCRVVTRAPSPRRFIYTSRRVTSCTAPITLRSAQREHLVSDEHQAPTPGAPGVPGGEKLPA